jgi:predicted phage baseplate assembly protein
MALAPVLLDDLGWDDLVSAAKRRIPALSGGRWTLHAPVDPGITLVELYAWLLDQRLFWLDQVPDSLLRNIVALLGDAVQPARSAATVLRLEDAAAAAQANRAVPAGAELSVIDADPAIWFTTRDGVTLLDLASAHGAGGVGLWVGGRDRTADLAEGKVLRLFRADGQPDEVKVVLWLSTDPPAAGQQALGLLIELFDPGPSPSVPPEWSPDAVSVAAPAALRFLYSAAGAAREFNASAVHDGTGGMRRSGVLRLDIPGDWAVDADAGVVAGAKAYSIIVRTDAATFTAPPRLLALSANVVLAEQSRAMTQSSREAWLPLPGVHVQLATESGPPLPDSVVLEIRERASGWQTWAAVADLSQHGSSERVFWVDRAAGALRFGDGLTGRIPVLDALAAGSNVRVRWRAGGGPAGAVASGTALEGGAPGAPPDLNATSVVEALGGDEPETPAHASARVASSLRAVERAVTAPDHETLAMTVPGVAIPRAHAAAGYLSSHPCGAVPGATTVFVVPAAPRDQADDVHEDALVASPQPDPGALAAVRTRMQAARLAGSLLCVCGPNYRPVQLLVDVDSETTDGASLRRRVAEWLRDYLDPLLGGQAGRGWPFGEPLRPSELLRQAQLALAGDGDARRVTIGLDGAAPSESCAEVAIGPHDLVSVESIVVRITSAPAARGGLR